MNNRFENESESAPAIMQKLITATEKELRFTPPRPPRLLNLHACALGPIAAKLWVSVNLSHLKAVPNAVNRLVKVFTLSDTVELKGAQIKIREVELEEMPRTSAQNIGLSLAKAYLPQILSITAAVLGSSNIGDVFTFIPKGIATGAKWLVGKSQSSGKHEELHDPPAEKAASTGNSTKSQI